MTQIILLVAGMQPNGLFIPMKVVQEHAGKTITLITTIKGVETCLGEYEVKIQARRLYIDVPFEVDLGVTESNIDFKRVILGDSSE